MPAIDPTSPYGKDLTRSFYADLTAGTTDMSGAPDRRLRSRRKRE